MATLPTTPTEPRAPPRYPSHLFALEAARESYVARAGQTAAMLRAAASLRFLTLGLMASQGDALAVTSSMGRNWFQKGKEDTSNEVKPGTLTR